MLMPGCACSEACPYGPGLDIFCSHQPFCSLVLRSLHSNHQSIEILQLAPTGNAKRPHRFQVVDGRGTPWPAIDSVGLVPESSDLSQAESHQEMPKSPI